MNAAVDIQRDVMERLAKELAAARRDLEQTATKADAALAVLRAKWTGDLKERADRVAELEAALVSQVERAPSLFKRPKSIECDGVRFGWRTSKGRLELPDQKLLLKRMGTVLTKAQRAAAIKVKVTILKTVLSSLSGDLLKRLGVSVVGAGSEAYVSYPKSDYQKLIDWWMKPVGTDEEDEKE